MENLATLDTKLSESEVRDILGLSEPKYHEALRSGALPATGKLRRFPPTRENFHTLWDVLHFRLYQTLSQTVMASDLNAAISLLLDEISREADSSISAEEVLLYAAPTLDTSVLSDLIRHWFAEAAHIRFDAKELMHTLINAYVDCLDALGLSESASNGGGWCACAAQCTFRSTHMTG